MSRHSDIKKTVLRGVYEDNAGIPRSCHGKRLPLPPLPPAEPPAPVDRPGYRGKVVLVVLLGLVALFGINFRLIKVDGTGPVAMQVTPARQSTTLPVSMPAIPGDILFPAHDLPARAGSGETRRGASITTGHYDAMLADLGIPMADLFNLKVQTIVIDPGHGGIDPGATGHQGLMEKDVALDIAKRLRKKLGLSGKYHVRLTRQEDKKLSLKERVAFAKDHRADLFISIHVNSLPASAGNLNIVETYYFGPHTDQRTLELAEKENRDSDYVIGDFREVIARIGDTLKTEESRELADSLHRRLYYNLQRRNGALVDAGSKTGPFMVLLGVEVPSVLVEVSCISNKAEETRLSMPAYRDDVAEFLKTGIVEYLERRSYRRTIEGGKRQNVAKQER